MHAPPHWPEGMGGGTMRSNTYISRIHELRLCISTCTYCASSAPLPSRRAFPGPRTRCSSASPPCPRRSEEHTSELQSRLHLVCRLLLEKKKYLLGIAPCVADV